MPALTHFDTCDRSGRPALCPLGTNYIDTFQFTAGEVKTITIPSVTQDGVTRMASYAIFSKTGSDIAVRFDGGVAVFPTTTATGGTGSAINPAQRRMPTNLSSISVAASAAGAVTLSIEWYA